MKPTTEEFRVFRGDKASLIVKDPVNVGEVYTTKNWFSTATHVEVAKDFGESSEAVSGYRIWDIRMPDGHRAIVTNQSEVEIILPKGSHFRIIRVDKPTGGDIAERVIAEVIETPPVVMPP